MKTKTKKQNKTKKKQQKTNELSHQDGKNWKCFIGLSIKKNMNLEKVKSCQQNV